MKAAIINAAMGKWYPKGQQRLIRGLGAVGFSHDILAWCNDPINEIYDSECPYTIKAAAVAEAMRLGYDAILWVDCSLWPIVNPDGLIERVASNGAFFILSGFNLAQTASDNALGIAGISRDQAERIPELWSCIFGLDLRGQIGKGVAAAFIDYSVRGMFHGSREHDGQSSDPRFLFHRQDQTALTIACQRYGRNATRTINTPNFLHQDASGPAPEGAQWLMRGL